MPTMCQYSEERGKRGMFKVASAQTPSSRCRLQNATQKESDMEKKENGTEKDKHTTNQRIFLPPREEQSSGAE